MYPQATKKTRWELHEYPRESVKSAVAGAARHARKCIKARGDLM
jgi:hypothetical protein